MGKKRRAVKKVGVDVHQEVTNRVIKALEKGVKPWVKPWGAGASFLPINPITGTQYSGINVLLLWITQTEQNFTSNHWLTYKQATTAGAQVKKGEKAQKSFSTKRGSVKAKTETSNLSPY
ncbi:antirestriction protein [Vibrio astriarenae]|nr:antirestriction protein [Vibrio sp. C7]